MRDAEIILENGQHRRVDAAEGGLLPYPGDQRPVDGIALSADELCEVDQLAVSDGVGVAVDIEMAEEIESIESGGRDEIGGAGGGVHRQKAVQLVEQQVFFFIIRETVGQEIVDFHMDTPEIGRGVVVEIAANSDIEVKGVTEEIACLLSTASSITVKEKNIDIARATVFRVGVIHGQTYAFEDDRGKPLRAEKSAEGFDSGLIVNETGILGSDLGGESVVEQGKGVGASHTIEDERSDAVLMNQMEELLIIYRGVDGDIPVGKRCFDEEHQRVGFRGEVDVIHRI